MDKRKRNAPRPGGNRAGAPVPAPALSRCLSLVARAGGIFTDALFPRRCPVCGKIVMPKGELICPGCRAALSYVRQPVCMRCGKEIASELDEYCPDCAKRRRAFERGIALLNYNEAARSSLAAVKYHNKREYLDFYAEEMARSLGPAIHRLGVQALVPVPVHPARLRARGFNQAAELSSRLGKRLGLPNEEGVLFRTKKTLPQKDLGPAERLKNLEQAFEAKNIPAGLEAVLLVDDIYTTGSTAEACAKALKRAGVRRVYFAVVAIGSGR